MPELEHEFKGEKRCIKYAREAGYLMSVIHAIQDAVQRGETNKVADLVRKAEEYDREVWRAR
jgi:hypothetical protein